MPTQVFSSWDIGVFLLLWAMGFFWSVSQGTRFLKIAILSIYVSFVVVSALSLERILLSLGSATLIGYGVACLVVLVVITYLLARSVRPDSSRAWWRGFFLSAIVAGFFIFFLIQNIPAAIIHPSAIVRTGTDGVWQRVFWTVIPLLGTVIL
jgi:hypothetical protein